MTSRISIIGQPANIGMLSDLPLLDHEKIDELGVEVTDVIVEQMRGGGSILLTAFILDSFKSYPVALIGLYPESETVANFWFYPTKYIKQFALPLIRQGPLYITGLKVICDYDEITTLIEAENKNFKKFAKLSGFHYSSDLVLNGVAFEEWRFGE